MSMASTEKELKGGHVLAMIIAFFGVIIGVNLVMAYFANSTWSGLVVANGYVASQSFDKDLAKARAQEALGWKVDFTQSEGRIRLTFTDANGEIIGRRLLRHNRLRTLLPAGCLADARLEITHAGQVLVEPFAVARANLPLQAARLGGHRVHNTLTDGEPAHLRGDLRRRAGDKETPEDLAWLILGRDHYPATRPGEAVLPLLNVDPHREGGETGQVADPLRRKLIERDRVAESAAARVRRTGQEAVVRRMAGVDVRMPDAAEDGEVVPVGTELLEVWRELIAEALRFRRREEVPGKDAKIVADREEPARQGRWSRGPREGRNHGVEKRQPERHARATEKTAPPKRSAKGDV